MRRVLSVLWLAVLLATAPAGQSRPVPLRILHVTDVHGRLLPTEDYDGHRDVGGLLRCATLIEQLRTEQPSCLLLDGGDCFQGSAESWLTQGHAVLRAMAWLRLDAWAVGNHEFDWGLPALQSLHDDSPAPMLAANLLAAPGKPHPLPRVRPYLIKEIDGVRVAVVGLTTPGIPSWSLPELLGDVQVEGSLAALQRVMPAVRAEAPDVLVLLGHQGFKLSGDDHANEVNAIAQAYPEFDVIIGAHTHQAVERAMPGGRVFYTQAGYYAAWLGQIDLTYDTVARRVVEKTSILHRIDASVSRHAGLEEVLAPDLARATTYLARVVGRVDEPLDVAPDALGRSGVQQFICRAISRAAGVSLALHGLLGEDAVPAGPVTMEQVWRIVPFENRIGVLRVTPGELVEMLQENLARAGSSSFMGPYGFDYEVEQGDAGPRVTRVVLADGTVPHPRQRLDVAVNSYVLASGGRRFPVLLAIAERPETRTRLLEADTRGAVIRLLERGTAAEAP